MVAERKEKVEEGRKEGVKRVIEKM